MKKIIAFILITLVVACSTDDGAGNGPNNGNGGNNNNPDPTGFDRSAMLANWADNIIIPSYQAFDTEVEAMRNSFATLQGDLTEANLIAFRQSWLSAYQVWQYAAPYEIGPAENVDLRLNINTYPTNTTKIEDFVTNGGYDLSLPSNREAKGFPALDYLINGLGTTDSEIIMVLTNVGGEAYLVYINDVLADMDVTFSTVLTEWTADYRDTFVSNSGSSATASVDRMVNDYIFWYEKFLRAGKMGIPLGVFSGSPIPENVESYYGEVSKALFLSGFQAAQDFFNGKHYNSNSTGESLASYLNALGTEIDNTPLANLINTQFTAAQAAVSNLSSFKDELENNNPPTQMLLAYDEVQRLVPYFKVDMVSALSISIDFVDADGD